jgi:CHAT domain-containing protein
MKTRRYLIRSILLFLFAIGLCFLPLLVAKGTATETPSLEQQSRSHYEAGQYQDAIDLLQQSIQDYAAQADPLRQAIALGNLAQVYQQLGNWTEANTAIATSLDLLQGDSASPVALAQILDIQGKLQLSQGQSEQAFTTWERAAVLYEQADDSNGRTRSQINQAQALQELGLYRRSIALLTDLNQRLQAQPNLEMRAIVLRRLGDALLVTGDLKQARVVLQQSLSLSATADLHLSLGNLVRAEAIAHLGFKDLVPAEAVALLDQSGPNEHQAEAVQKFMQETQSAIDLYQQAAIETTLPETQTQARLNLLSLLIETGRWQLAQTVSADLAVQLERLPLSRASLYDRIGFAQNLIKLAESGDRATHLPNDRIITQPIIQPIVQLLTTARQQAEQLQDVRAQSFALGALGQLYEQAQAWTEARSLTQQALILAQGENANDIAYRWQWQIGRLLKAQNDRLGAITAYTEAINTLKILRSDLVAINRDVQFSFRESVEPVYRQLVDLLLQPGSDVNELQQARGVIEGLQIAALDNFFREACLDTAFQLDRVVDQAQQPAAIFYTIELSDRLEVILKLPQQPLLHYSTNVSQAEIQATVNTLLSELKRPFVTRTSQNRSRQIYDWLIRPVEATLAEQSIETLVFVLDGALRNIPMSALYDGQRYLVEQYSVALAPGLQLLDPKPLGQERLRALVAGLSAAREDFPPLSFVQTEVDGIRSDIASDVLFNESFTRENLRDRLRRDPVSIVHIATHGQFSSNADETFILAWDSPIRINELSQLLETRSLNSRNPIELLVLSACRTAVGDRRATLGLAGMAVRAGARSTIASLWSLDDNSGAVLMNEFYKELTQNSGSKAESLRQAQRTLLANPQYAAPRFWAPYVLLGNWL